MDSEFKTVNVFVERAAGLSLSIYMVRTSTSEALKMSQILLYNKYLYLSLEKA